MKKLFALLLIAVVFLGAGAAAAQTADWSGTWTGFAEIKGHKDGLTLVLEKRNGATTGKISDELGMFQEAPIFRFAQNGDLITFEFEASGSGHATVPMKAELKAAGGSWKGTLFNVGTAGSWAMELARKK